MTGFVCLRTQGARNVNVNRIYKNMETVTLTKANTLYLLDNWDLTRVMDSLGYNLNVGKFDWPDLVIFYTEAEQCLTQDQ